MGRFDKEIKEIGGRFEKRKYANILNVLSGDDYAPPTYQITIASFFIILDICVVGVRGPSMP